MSEEVNDASKTIPNVVMWAVGSNALMLLVVGITYIFCLGDLDSVLNTPTYQPVIQVFFNATQSRAGTTGIVAILIVIFLSACVGQVATASRQMWSFARDKGMIQRVLGLCLWLRDADCCCRLPWFQLARTGSAWMEHPHSCNCSVVGDNLYAVADQYW
jgi:amino acid transporter